MIKKILLTILTLQAVMFADFQGVVAEDMLELQKKGAPIIDIRTPGEWKETGVIPGTTKIMFFDEKGGYDVEKFLSELKKVVKNEDQPFILVCRTASRTKMVGRFLAKDLGYKHVKELTGGIMFGWQQLGKQTVK
jgi:rhodanese-related sulfurtransferase